MTNYTNSIEISHRSSLSENIHLYNEQSNFEKLLLAILEELEDEFYGVRDLFTSKAVSLYSEVEGQTEFNIFKILNHYRAEPTAYREFILKGRPYAERVDSNFVNNSIIDFWRIFVLHYVSAASFSQTKNNNKLSIELLDLVEKSLTGESSFLHYNVEYSVDFKSAKEYFLETHSEIYFKMKELGAVDFLDGYFMRNPIIKTIYLKGNARIKCY